MKLMSDNEIKKNLSNVKATLAIEGLKMNKRAITNGHRYLRGKVTSEQAIDDITKYIKGKIR
ncbi:antitoxin VbhA family protein [Phosphitispora fastidiosa]|uniref:antitoxin VbhA family protein n=1 Tax=Phosphitispora fastidiosa TaxID=2837202 RepID=UPI001E3BE3A9|nr:antitoxin VbhA family protein [Phosphitispora fastidiosa]MBU7006597.1 hypothetical protein [Phosphitispora fastidiosa]